LSLALLEETVYFCAMMKLYVKVWCPWCIEAEAWLKKRGLAYEQVDVLADSAAYARMREISGQSLTPTLELPDGDVLEDFDVRQLDKFLRQKALI
jgi:glutaredoxin